MFQDVYNLKNFISYTKNRKKTLYHARVTSKQKHRLSLVIIYGTEYFEDSKNFYQSSWKFSTAKPRQCNVD